MGHKVNEETNAVGIISTNNYFGLWSCVKAKDLTKLHRVLYV